MDLFLCFFLCSVHHRLQQLSLLVNIVTDPEANYTLAQCGFSNLKATFTSRFFFAHLNHFGSLREFLSKVLKLGNNDIVGGVALQWTRVVATYLTKNVADIKM